MRRIYIRVAATPYHLLHLPCLRVPSQTRKNGCPGACNAGPFAAVRGATLLVRSLVSTVLLLPLAATQARSQAGITASRPSSASVFAEGGSDTLNFRSASSSAFVLGADYTFHTRFQLDPSLEARITLAPGSDVSTNTFAFGLRLERPFFHARIVPFGNVLAGLGFLTFQHPTPNPGGSVYRSDDSVVLQVGGGLRFRVTPRWSVQAEAAQQRWRLGQPPEASFQPTLVTAGITYTFPFGPERRRRD